VNTKLFLPRVGPHGPITHAGLVEVLVDDAAHPELIERRVEGQAVNIARAEGGYMPADFA
jgi:hypothetical protein